MFCMVGVICPFGDIVSGGWCGGVLGGGETGCSVLAARLSSCEVFPMTDPTVNLEEIKRRVWKFAEERDWPQFHSPKNLSMALAAESGELMEHFLWCSPEESRTAFADPEKAAKIREELADVVIYAIQFANVTQTDLAAAIADKMSRNAAKYPVEKAKGSSRKYDQL